MSNGVIESVRSDEVGFGSKGSFELMQRAAKLLASSSLVPKIYQGDGGVPNCVIALNMALRIGADPLMVMQNLYVVHGNPAWSAQFLIATFNTCGRFSAIRYRFTGERGTDNWGCVANSIELGTGELIEGSEVTIALAKKEGWYAKSGSKWQTMPQQMLMYRAAAWFVRAYAPELAMGIKTVDEVEDYTLEQAPIGGSRTSLLESKLGVVETKPVEPKAEVKYPLVAQDVPENASEPMVDFWRKMVVLTDIESLRDWSDFIDATPALNKGEKQQLWSEINRRIGA